MIMNNLTGFEAMEASVIEFELAGSGVAVVTEAGFVDPATLMSWDD